MLNIGFFYCLSIEFWYNRFKIEGKVMKILGNIIWFIFGGLFVVLVWFILGIFLCIIIIGILIGL